MLCPKDVANLRVAVDTPRIELCDFAGADQVHVAVNGVCRLELIQINEFRTQDVL